jgi:hypothetical protein
MASNISTVCQQLYKTFWAVDHDLRASFAFLASNWSVKFFLFSQNPTAEKAAVLGKTHFCMQSRIGILKTSYEHLTIILSFET